MNWENLRIILVAAQHRTLTEAAARLGVNQTTVSRRLAALQEELGVRLIERTADGISLTPAGQRIREAAERMDEAVTSLDREILGLDERLMGLLRVTTLDMIAAQNADLFQGFVTENPGIDLELTVGDAVRNLNRREADVAIRWSNAPPEYLVGRKVARAEYALYGARALLKGEAGQASLDTYPWLGWQEAKSATLTEQWRQKHAPRARVVCRYDSALALNAAVTAGQGIAFMPCAYGDLDPEVIRLRPPEPGFGMDIWVLTHPDLRDNARVRSFMQWVPMYFEPLRPLFAGRGGD